MSNRLAVDIFVEDRAQEVFVEALVNRIAQREWIISILIGGLNRA